jgi:hypothetical protein
MGKRGLMFALSLVLMLIIIASLGALYFVSEESLTKYIILGFMALFVFLLVLDTIIHFSSKAYKLRKKLSSINIKEGDLDDLKNSYMQIYSLYMKLSEKQKQNFYAKINMLREALEEQLRAEKKVQLLLEDVKKGSTGDQKKVYAEIEKNFQKLSRKVQEKYNSQVMHIKEGLNL